MSLLLNRAKEVTATTGTGTVTLAGAVIPIGASKFQTWSAAGAVNGLVYDYLIEDGGDWELGYGTYTSSGTTLSRTLVASSTGSLLNLSGFATVACCARQETTPQVIAKTTMAGGETSWSTSNIPQVFSALELEIFGRLSSGGSSGNLTLTFNSDTGANYYLQRLYANGTSTNANPKLGDTSLGNTTAIIQIPGSTYTANQAAGLVIRIVGYTSAFHKPIKGLPYYYPNNTSTKDGYEMTWDALWTNTAALTSIQIPTLASSGTFAAGSYVVLRGLP